MLRYTLNPTTHMNINELRIALLNFIVSKQKKEDLIIKIENSDKENFDESISKENLNILHLFAIDYMQVLEQKNNLKYHQQIAMQLLVDKKAFNCFCSDEALEKDGGDVYSGFCENLHDEITFNINAPFRVRIKKPKDSKEIDSFFILNHDKSPTKVFATAIDDMLSNISTIIRDEKYLSTMLEEKYIRDQFGYDKELDYIHIKPLIDNTNLSVKELIDNGYLPIAIANYLVSLGINTPNEIFTIEEAIEWFDCSKIFQDEMRFDMNELDKFNIKHIQIFDNMRLSKILGYADDDIGKLAKLYLEHFSTTNEIKKQIDAIFNVKTNVHNELKECIEKAPFFDKYEDFTSYIIKNTSFDESNLEEPLEYLILGETNEIKLELVYPFIKNYLGEIVC